MLLLDQVLSVALAPVNVLRNAVTSRVVSTINAGHTRAQRLRPSKNYSLPLLEYSNLSSLYFAIEQAVLDDEVRAVQHRLAAPRHPPRPV